MLPFSHHTIRHHSHLDRKGVSIFDEEGLYSEALAECCSLVNSSQGYSLICVEAPDKVGPGRGERRGEEGRGEEWRGEEWKGGERREGKAKGGEGRKDEGKGGRHQEKKGRPYSCHFHQSNVILPVHTQTRIPTFHTAPYSTITIT